MAQSCCLLGRRLLVHDLGSPGCRAEPGEGPSTERGPPAHQLGPALTTLFTPLAQLQKAADPWVLKHSDLEKQDNSWKEVSRAAVRPCPFDSWLHWRKPLSCGGCSPCPTGHILVILGSSTLGSLRHVPSLWWFPACGAAPVKDPLLAPRSHAWGKGWVSVFLARLLALLVSYVPL